MKFPVLTNKSKLESYFCKQITKLKKHYCVSYPSKAEFILTVAVIPKVYRLHCYPSRFRVKG